MMKISRQGYTGVRGLKELARKKRHHWLKVLIIGLILLLVMVALQLMIGKTIYSPKTIIQVLSGSDIPGASFAIKTIRLPRLLIGLLVGFAFGVSGYTFQTLLGNQLASPDIIGISSGTSGAALFAILYLGLSGPLVSYMAVAFGLLVAAGIYCLTGGGHFFGGRLILIGIGVQAMLKSLISYMLLGASEYDIAAAMRWLSGSLNTMDMADVLPLFCVVTIGSTIIILLGRSIRMMTLGESAALSLGVSVGQVRLMAIVCAVCIIAFATSVTGPIAFVAFLSGPLAIRLVGTDVQGQVISGIVGALIVLIADFVGQNLLQIKLPVGVITGIIGSPYLLLLLIRMNKQGGSA